MRKLFETKLYSRNLIKRMDTKAKALVRYPGLFLKLTNKELKQRDLKPRKLIMRLEMTLIDNIRQGKRE